MLLAVDIGNTSSKFGIFDGEKLLSRFSAPTAQTPQPDSLGDLRDVTITRAIVCSVVPSAVGGILELLQQRKIKAIQVTNDLDFGLTVNYEPLSSLGTDRLVNAFAAVEKYGPPAIVCSLGTATTIDVVDSNRIFRGGIIAPGVRTASNSLRVNTSQLPEISIEAPEALIGTTTGSAILSGIGFGHVAMFEGLIERLTKELGEKPVVVATGGFAPLIDQMTDVIDKVDLDLTLNGLRILNSRMAQT